MKKAIILKSGCMVTENAEIADNFLTRFKGLMFRKSIDDNYALHITPCNRIHCFNMRFAIDIIYLSPANEVLKIDKNIKPWKVCKQVKKAKSVIEMKAFMASELGIREGDVLEIRKK